MKVFYSIAILTATLNCFAAHADETDNVNAQTQFIEQAAENDSAIIQADNSTEQHSGSNSADKKFLGRITNSSTHESIEIYSLGEDGQTLGFFKVIGPVAPADPFKIMATSGFEKAVDSKKPDFKVTPGLDWELNKFGEGDWTVFMVGAVFGLTEAMLAYDVVISPIHLPVGAIKAHTYKKAKRNLYRAITSGSTVVVNSHQYKKILSFLE